MTQTNLNAPVRLLGISGSLRLGAYSTQVLHALAAITADRAHVDVVTLHDVPLYNADHDGDQPPPGVAALKAAIASADALVICSPEYNYGIPGVLKNAIDWASRPGFNSPLKGKPALIMTASPGTAGGIRAQAQIRDTLSAVLARPVARQHVAIAGVGSKVADSRFTDDATATFVSQAVDDLLGEVRLLRAHTQAAV